MIRGSETGSPPGRVDPRHESGEERQRDGEEDHRCVEPEEIAPLRDGLQPAVQRRDPGERESEPEDPAQDPDELALDDVLEKDVSPRRAEGPADADLVRAREELPEEQPDEVQGADGEEEERHYQERRRLPRHDALFLHPCHDGRHAVVHGTRQAARLLLLQDVRPQEVLVGGDLLGRRQLDPHLDPVDLGLEEAGEPGRGRRGSPAVRVARRADLHRLDEVEGDEDVLRRLDLVLRDVVELDARLPVVEDADDAELPGSDPHRLADRARAAEKLLVHLGGKYGDGLGAGVGGLVPPRPVPKRHVEHGEKVREDEADVLAERPADLRIRIDVHPRLERSALPRRDRGSHDPAHVPVRYLRRRHRRVGSRIGTERIPVVDPDVVEDVALLGDRVAGERVARRGGSRRKRDSEGDAAHDQDSERRVPLQALPGDPQVVEQHGRLLRRSSRRESRKRDPRRRPSEWPSGRRRSRRGGEPGGTPAPRTPACA